MIPSEKVSPLSSLPASGKPAYYRVRCSARPNRVGRSVSRALTTTIAAAAFATLGSRERSIRRRQGGSRTPEAPEKRIKQKRSRRQKTTREQKERDKTAFEFDATRSLPRFWLHSHDKEKTGGLDGLTNLATLDRPRTTGSEAVTAKSGRKKRRNKKRPRHHETNPETKQNKTHHILHTHLTMIKHDTDDRTGPKSHPTNLGRSQLVPKTQQCRNIWEEEPTGGGGWDVR